MAASPSLVASVTEGSPSSPKRGARYSEVRYLLASKAARKIDLPRLTVLPADSVPPHNKGTMRLIRVSCGMILLMMTAACTPARVSSVGNLKPLEHPVTRVAIAPGAGVLGDAIGIGLMSGGFDIVDTQQTTTWMVRANLDEFELMQPENLSQLADQGIDAIVVVRTVAGYDDRPQSASVRVISTRSSSLIGGLAWQNGRAGAQGSAADGDMRKDIVAAAEQIASALVKQLRR